MKFTQHITALILVLVVAAVFSWAAPGFARTPAAPGWVVAHCPPEFGKAREEFAQAVKSAKEGGSVYTLHPFPSSEEQVFEIYLDHMRSSVEWTGPSKNMESTEDDYRRVLDGVMERKVDFKIQRVEEWQESYRCSLDIPREYYYIVRVFESGRETIRGVILDSGLWIKSSFSEKPEGFLPLIPLDETRRLLESRFGIGNASDLQFVDAFVAPGNNFCSMTSPCVAARAGKDILLLESDRVLSWNKPRHLLRIDPNGRRESFARDKNEPQAFERNQALWSSVSAEAGQRWVSIGGRSQTAWLVEPVDY